MIFCRVLMKVLEKNQAQASLSEYVDQVDYEPIIVQIHGKPVAVLMSLEDVNWETISLGDCLRAFYSPYPKLSLTL